MAGDRSAHVIERDTATQLMAKDNKLGNTEAHIHDTEMGHNERATELWTGSVGASEGRAGRAAGGSGQR